MEKIKNILIVGSGGIGCELIKLLPFRTTSNITIIDFDTIELTNLNRQFFFSEKDLGNYKSKIAGEKLREMTNWNIRILTDSIFNYDLCFFREFDVVYNCLDDEKTRTFVNVRCFLSKVKLIDGGSSGYKGQACIFDYLNECFDCLPKQVKKNYNICTIRTLPTKFDHCIEYIKSIFFDESTNIHELSKMKTKTFYNTYLLEKILIKKKLPAVTNLAKLSSTEIHSSKKYFRQIKSIKKDINNLAKAENNDFEYSKDNITKVKLLYKLSCLRAKSVGIKKISFFDFQSIANNIVPSLCTTNSMVASLMLLAEQRNLHYFLTLSGKLVNKIEPDRKKADCQTCSYKWIRMAFKEKFRCLELFTYLHNVFNVSFTYFISYENVFYTKLQNNLCDEVKLSSNTVNVIGNDLSCAFKVYIEKIGSDFEIIN